MLDQIKLKEMLSYDMDTGEMKWIRDDHKLKGKVVGYIKNGYRLIGLTDDDGVYKQYPAHRLAFLYMIGEMPEFVDHINHNRDDNRWVNLRPATKKSNSRNQTLRNTNTSGHNGVYWKKGCQRWVARIHIDNKDKHLGTFKTKEEAIEARRLADIQYGYHSNHGNLNEEDMICKLN